VTTFIIESKKLLQEDVGGISRDILITISNQLANSSTPAYTAQTFIPKHWAVRVNCILFSSLFLNLIVTLGAVMALQWVGNYDAGLDAATQERRAFQRQFRYDGMRYWKMSGVIMTLPLLIFLALFLFLFGLTYWLYKVDSHSPLAIVTLAGSTLASLFYLVTTIIGIVSISSPYRTSISKVLPIVTNDILNRFRQARPIHSRESAAIDRDTSLGKNSILWAFNSIEVIPGLPNYYSNVLLSLTRLDYIQWTEENCKIFFSDRLMELYSIIINRCTSSNLNVTDPSETERAKNLFQFFGWIFWMHDSEEGKIRTSVPAFQNPQFARHFQQVGESIDLDATSINSTDNTSIMCAFAGWSRFIYRKASGSNSVCQDLAGNLRSELLKDSIQPECLARELAKLTAVYSDHVISNSTTLTDQREKGDMTEYKELITRCFKLDSMSGQRRMWIQKLKSMDQHALPSAVNLWFHPLITDLENIQTEADTKSRPPPP
jgi:hypothetical protein